MSAPISPPSPQAITEALSQIGLSGDGATADAWRAQMQTSASIAAHLESVAAAVAVAKERAVTALRDYTDSAPTAAEIDAAQQELLAASQSDDPGDPGRLKRAEDKLGELLARRERAEAKYHKDTADNLDQLGADHKAADEQLSPEARAKLAQLLQSLAAAPASAMPMGAGAPAAPGAAPAAGRPGSGFNPSSDVTDTSDFGPSVTGGEEPGQTHTSSDSSPVMSAPTLTNATTAVPTGAESTPVAVAGPGSPAGPGGAAMGGMPMMPGMGMGGPGRQPAGKREGEASGTESKLDRDEVLNGDDLLNRSVKGRL
ncbi:hypothetical protein BKG82_28095 [Mycobacteroides chelonae]|uniref:Uncharacterized protein n=1 Tax=Mycobacteroides chelonae TaxID=1774 RepID=A0A1S1LGY6_MYCCH|nr:hypothetical protein [Mycobacteroides chelonae]OHU46072.1 hypothetical protein BKG82_28095 [Mycobacteroides chelonae]